MTARIFKIEKNTIACAALPYTTAGSQAEETNHEEAKIG